VLRNLETEFLPLRLPRGSRRSQPRRSGRRRSRREVEEERKQLREQTEREIDTLFAEMNLNSTTGGTSGIGVIYARYSTEFQHSVADQIRACLEAALRLGLSVPRSHIFYDLAISGSKERRPGLNAARALLARKGANVLLVLTTNRLFRKGYKCMKFVEEEVVERGLRCVFVKTGIDTDQGTQWRLPLQVHSLVDEMTGTMYADNIRAAHEGLFLKQMVIGTLSFGYIGQDVDGPLTKRHRPRQKIVINPEEAEWVLKIFTWFVVDRLALARIIERLNSEDSPLPPKAFGGYWTHQALRYLIENPCYRGAWAYGKGKNVWQSKQDYSKRVLREKPLREAQFENLRLVTDEMWYQAQRLMLESPQRAGRKPLDGNRVTRPRVLNGILMCQVHDRPLKVSGNRGQWMACTICRNLPKEERPLHNYVSRRLALRKICEAIAEQIRADKTLVQSIIDSCQLAFAQATRPEESRITSLRAHRDRLTRQIEFVLQNAGISEDDRQESTTRLQALRAERATIAADLSILEAAASRPVIVPGEEEVAGMLEELEQILVRAAVGNDPEDAGMVRTILELLTGGRIEIVQGPVKAKRRGWVIARFRLRLLCTSLTRLQSGVLMDEDLGTEMTVEIRNDTIAEQFADRVHELAEQGMLITAIGEKLGIERHQVTDALQIWHERRGLSAPVDGRIRRAEMPQKLLKPPVFQAIAEEVKLLYDQGFLIEDIATKVGRIKDTVRSALKFWFSSRGEEMPDGRNRRKTLERKQRRSGDSSDA